MEANENDEESSLLKDVKFPMLEFEKRIFIDVFEKDALVIMAKGLNYNNVISNLLWVHKDPGNLVLVINSGEHEEKYFTERFGLSPLPALGPDREKTYLEGGVHFVTTRVLVVDLLKSRVPIAHVTGIIVLRAHTILESCQEAFALRLYRQKNKTGFIKAFSHSPVSFTFGYHQVEKVMKALFVTELFLWPRFHGTVIASLKRRSAAVEELHVPLSANTTQIQACLLDIMNYTVKQLKTINRTLDLQEISTENCLSKKFHKILQSQLDCVWHQLSTRTKELAQDLKALRGMIVNLIHDDAVSFYALVSKYRSAEYARVNSGWILLDSAETLFRLAKGRVYNHSNEFDPEPCPKWKVLSDLLLQEIPDEVKKNENGDLNNTKILVLCQDNKTCAQLNLYLTMGAQRYLFYTAFRRELTIGAIAPNYKAYKDAIPTQEVKKSQDAKDGEAEDEFDADDNDRSNYVLTLTQVPQSGKKKKADESMFEPISQMESLDLSQLELAKPIVCLQPFKAGGDQGSLERTLQALRPHYVVFYHSDVAAVRQLEVWESRKAAGAAAGAAASRVYVILHAHTVEEQTYLSALKREKLAFELLIQAKSVMVVPTYQDGKTDEYFNMNETTEDDSVDTRKAGGQNQQKERPVVIVDIREFRSDLPALLHKRGINIEPVMITIGDYILTPELCVERKSWSDLVGSLQSGRLFAQATAMSRHYARPVLLIEFDQNRPFNMQGNMAVSSDLSGSDWLQRLQLLTIHFPRLKIVWSPSPYATAELFYELKQGRRNPSAAEAVAVGGEGTDEASVERYNARAHDLLRRLPGVCSRSLPRLMNRARSLDHLIQLTQEEIEEITENKNDAQAIHAILHVPAQPADVVNKEEKPWKGKYRGRNLKGKAERKN